MKSCKRQLKKNKTVHPNKCGEGIKHYQVTSPTITTQWNPWEPQETYACWAEFTASSKKEALKMAVQSLDFKDWVTDARSDNRNPFSDLKVDYCLCEHGVCWACEPLPDSEFACEQCHKEYYENL